MCHVSHFALPEIITASAVGNCYSYNSAPYNAVAFVIFAEEADIIRSLAQLEGSSCMSNRMCSSWSVATFIPYCSVSIQEPLAHPPLINLLEHTLSLSATIIQHVHQAQACQSPATK